MRVLTHRGQAGPGGLKGVSRADVSFRTKEARVVFDRAHVTVEQMIEAVGRAGFHASLKTEQTK